MKIPKEVQCKTCSQVFCCAKCRKKHEDNKHKEMKAIRQICYICNNRPFPLRTDTKITPNNLLVEHILREHLPLRCNRCSKIFHTASDFESITRCSISNDRGIIGAPHFACQLESSAAKIQTIIEAPVENTNAPELEAENKENIIGNSSVESSNHYNGHSEPVPQTAIKVTKATTVTLATPLISKELRAITDPIEEICDINKAMLTPLSMINLRWKRKSRQSFDSMLCVTSNISAVNASSEDTGNGQVSPNKKLVRTTSTPMMHGCLPYMKGVANESYTSAMGQMSSIHHSNSGSDSESKTEDPIPSSPAAHEILPKVRAISRGRSRAVTTPLRQVMSKSIQRAIAQHGYYSKIVAPGTQRKMSFSSTGSSSLNSTSGSSSREALDLRTTPVLKRASSESVTSSGSGSHRTAKMICLPKKPNDASEENRDSSSKYYDTRPTLDISSQLKDQENRKNQRIDEESLVVHRRPKLKTAHNYQDTPKVAGGILKKAISFASPEITRLGESRGDDFDDDRDEIWATPCAVPPRSFSCSAIRDSHLDSIMTEDNSDASGSDDVFMPPTKTKFGQQHKLATQPFASTGRLWTIVTNVMRLASRSDVEEELAASGSASSTGSSGKDSKGSSSLLKKAASFAGFFKDRFPVRSQQPQKQRNSSSGSEEFAVPYTQEAGAGLKRRRTASLYTRPYGFIGNAAAAHKLTSSSPLAKRAKRIQGRQPIERMRSNSRSGGSASDI